MIHTQVLTIIINIINLRSEESSSSILSILLLLFVHKCKCLFCYVLGIIMVSCCSNILRIIIFDEGIAKKDRTNLHMMVCNQ